MGDIFRWEITFGDALNALLIIAGGAISVGIAGWRWYRRRYPIALDYPDQPIWSGTVVHDRTFSKTKMLQIGGDGHVPIRLRSRREVQFEHLSFRCVSRRWGTWNLRHADAPREVIYISAVQESGDTLAYLGEDAVLLPDGVGGQYLNYSREHRWPAGRPLWFIVNVSAKGSWAGELSVCIERGEPTRCYGRAELRVR